MSDPAIEAAKLAWAANEALDGIEYTPGEGGLWSPDSMETAAREALAPLRDLHRPFDPSAVRYATHGGNEIVCNHCLGPRKWPCPTALYLYTTEELEQ